MCVYMYEFVYIFRYISLEKKTQVYSGLLTQIFWVCVYEVRLILM